MNASPAGAHAERIAAFEGLRGYAVALVFLVHYVDHYFARAAGIDFNRFDLAATHSAAQWLAYWAWASHYGVDLFFFLSGFLIFRLAARPDFGYRRFLWHRLQRLYPAFAAALLVYVAYQATFWDRRYDWPTLLQNAVFLPGVFELGIPAIIVQSWSLGFEWLFYLSTPLWLRLVRRGGAPLHAGHVLLAGALTLALLLPRGPQYARFVMFFAGGLLAAAPLETVKTWIPRVPEGVVVAAYLAVTTFFVVDHDYTHFSGLYAMACLLLVAKATYGTGLLRRLFCWRPLRALGNISYSFYLLHALVLVAMIDHLGPRLTALPGALHFGVLLAISFAVGVGVSWLSFRWLEQPYFRRRLRRASKSSPARPTLMQRAGVEQPGRQLRPW